MENLLMVATVSLGAGRNILSKGIGKQTGGKYGFFFGQSLLFLGGTVIIFLLNPVKSLSFSLGVLPYALIYGVFLVLSQWLYTLSLKSGSVSVCSLVYSFGFIIPAVSGAVVWGEPFGIIKIIGIILAIICILLSVKSGQKAGKGKMYIVPLVIAMLSSGGLGVMQKVQQKSVYKSETNAFLLFAFAFAFILSFMFFVITKNEESNNKNAKYITVCALTGLCFGGANYINTILAGMIQSLVFFPLQNIATVILSAILGILIFKEKPTLKNSIGFIFGIAAIFVLKM